VFGPPLNSIIRTPATKLPVARHPRDEAGSDKVESSIAMPFVETVQTKLGLRAHDRALVTVDDIHCLRGPAAGCGIDY
jgi:hypothetical protein